MNNLINIDGLVNVYSPNQGLKNISSVGFENVFINYENFISMELKKRLETIEINNIEINDIEIDSLEIKEDFLKSVLKFQENLKSQNLKSGVNKAPSVQLNIDKAKLIEINSLLVKESIALSSKLGCKFLIVSPLSIGVTKEENWDINKKFYTTLASASKEHNVQILLENKPKDLHGHYVRGVCADPYEVVCWIEELNKEVKEEIFGFSMDMGVCNLFGQDIYDFIKIVQKYLKVVIIRDNDGRTNDSLMPFSAIGNGMPKTEWINLIRGLRSIFYDGEVVLNIKSTANVYSHLLHSTILQTSKAIIDFLIWQIEIEKRLSESKKIVLFGAGNMCKNYINSYGEKYPPMFTCDNNEERWGENFNGLEIKSPEELKNLPDDCVIFICNIFYSEIAEQLKKMGIKNKIEFFNDEYLPTLQFESKLG